MNTTQPKPNPINTNFWKNAPRDQRFGYGLLALGVLVVLGAINDGVAAFFTLGALALGFLVAHRRTGLHGFAVPGGIFAGIATGALLEGITPFDGIFLLGFAGGFWLIQHLEPKRHAWAIYPAWVFAAIAALAFVTENAWLVALGLVIGGFYLLRRQERRVSSDETVTEIVVAAPDKLELLRLWRSETATRQGLPEAEILRTEQLERLAKMTPESVDAMFGVLDAAQIEKHGKALLEVLRA
jgi:HRDC domain